ncbi:hypothetical protein B0J13DRAFT_520192 [Dactylonectria estremocensis]|uniref:Uncharacterized protein n=1 Tax=Dactylonectria estremocensis TaxID=1079267 RepID=A0A9P9JEQ5_9HYPO|nr:hypothetical protein B0J13DRAFT_520192 [Dactylonectria estremocensis]
MGAQRIVHAVGVGLTVAGVPLIESQLINHAEQVFIMWYSYWRRAIATTCIESSRERKTTSANEAERDGLSAWPAGLDCYRAEKVSKGSCGEEADKGPGMRASAAQSVGPAVAMPFCNAGTREHVCTER